MSNVTSMKDLRNRARATFSERAQARQRVLDAIRENRETLGKGYPDVRAALDLAEAAVDDRHGYDAGEAVRICQAAAVVIARMSTRVPLVLREQAEVAANVGAFWRLGRLQD